MHHLILDDAKEWFFENILEQPKNLVGGYEGAVG
jgi:hypothetical protein